jgi:nitrate/TMAO reductase-like tetraheme cytochrome c subunit
MKRIFLYVILIIFISLNLAFGGNIIKSNFPVSKLPPPERCASCHKIEKIYNEFSSSVHKDLSCFECHLPGKVQKEKYNRKERGFFRLGYHKNNDEWIEGIGNEACQRCHVNNGMDDTDKKCWSCHMPENGKDNIFILKDPMKPLIQDNIKEIKIFPHKSHTFIMHIDKQGKP